jgi:hypothetical protein
MICYKISVLTDVKGDPRVHMEFCFCMSFISYHQG